MKKLILRGTLATLLLATTMTLSAQAPRGGSPQQMQQGKERVEREKPTPEAVAEKMTEKMSEKLSLSADQKKKLYKVNLDFAKKKAEAAELDKKHMESIVSLLNAEQTVEFIEMKSKAKRGKRAPMGSNLEQRNPQMGAQGAPQGGNCAPQMGARRPQRGPKGAERPAPEVEKESIEE